MADTSIKLSGTYDSIEAYRILEEMQNMSTEYEAIKEEAEAASSAATAAVATANAAVTNATAAATNASTYADNANTSATAAAGSASTAATAADNALDSETAAASSASAASTSETNAAASETAAAASAAEAAATLSSKAPLDSPAFTGTPTVPTPEDSDNSTKIANTSWLENVFFSKLVAKLAANTAASISSLNTSSLFYRMLSWALTAAGVQYNFTNANAWYICLGALFGGLIIQGGTSQYVTVSANYFAWSDFTLPISITASRAVAVTSALGQFQKIASSTGQLTATTCRVLLNNLTTDAHSFSAYVIVISF